ASGLPHAASIPPPRPSPATTQSPPDGSIRRRSRRSRFPPMRRCWRESRRCDGAIVDAQQQERARRAISNFACRPDLTRGIRAHVKIQRGVFPRGRERVMKTWKGSAAALSLLAFGATAALAGPPPYDNQLDSVTCGTILKGVIKPKPVLTLTGATPSVFA